MMLLLMEKVIPVQILMFIKCDMQEVIFAARSILNNLS